MYRQVDGARQSVRMIQRGFKSFVFVHFNTFKSLTDRDMGVRGGVRHKSGPEREIVWALEAEETQKVGVGVQERDA